MSIEEHGMDVDRGAWDPSTHAEPWRCGGFHHNSRPEAVDADTLTRVPSAAGEPPRTTSVYFPAVAIGTERLPERACSLFKSTSHCELTGLDICTNVQNNGAGP